VCVAGACLALGLAFAGTGDASARHVLLSRLMYFRALRSTFPDDSKEGSGVASHPAHLESVTLPVRLYGVCSR
jgi:hypothetical protein